VTIDPTTSRDLDQALCLRKIKGGYRVHYAIADVTLFAPRGGELAAETWRRGEPGRAPAGGTVDNRPRCRWGRHRGTP
jgi:exoribonuclease II